MKSRSDYIWTFWTIYGKPVKRRFDIKTKTCCFTGHRDIPKKEYRSIKEKTEKEIITLINHGVICFGTGSARGFDTVAAEIVLKLKKLHPHIKLILVLPCTDQIKGWKLIDKLKYDYIMKNADKVKILSQDYAIKNNLKIIYI